MNFVVALAPSCETVVERRFFYSCSYRRACGAMRSVNPAILCLSLFEMGPPLFETGCRLGQRVRRWIGLRLLSTKITRHQGSTIVMIAFLAALDAFTLQLVAALVMLLTLVSATALWQMAPRETFSRYWAMGLGLICVGLVISSLREEMNANLVIVLGNTLVAMGGALVVNGVTRYC